MKMQRLFLFFLLVAFRVFGQSGADLISEVSGRVDHGGNGDSGAPAISANGRFVVFVSGAGNLTTNGITKQAVSDVYLHDRQTNETRLISVSRDGLTGADYHNWNPQISADGNRVMFESGAANLVSTATNGPVGVMVYDIATGSLLHGSVGLNGTNASAACRNALLSADGRTLVFESAAINLTTGIVYSTTQVAPSTHIFARDLEARKTELMDVSHQGNQAARSALTLFSSIVGVSSNGAKVAFLSNASNLVEAFPQSFRSNQLWIRDRTAGTNVLVSSISDMPSTRAIRSASMNADGTKFVFSHDRGSLFRDLSQSNSVPIQVPTNAVGLTLSPDGDLVAFFTRMTSKLSIGQVTNETFIELEHQFQTRETNLVFSADGGTLVVQTAFDESFEDVINTGGREVRIKAVNSSSLPAVSHDGGIIASDWFTTTNHYENVFVSENGTSTLISKAAVGSATAREPTQGPKAVSRDGRFTLYTSFAALVSEDSNGSQDVYLWDSIAKTNLLVSRAADGTGSGNAASFMPKMTPDGEYVVFASAATNLVEGDTNRMTDIFVWSRSDGTMRLVSTREEGVAPGIVPVVLACSWPVISKDGRFAAFVSRRQDLVAGSRRVDGIYVRDLENEITYAGYPTNSINSIWSRTVAVLEGPVVYYLDRTNLFSFNVTNGVSISYSNPVVNLSFSADEKLLAVLSRVSGIATLSVYHTGTGERQLVYQYPNAIAPSIEQSISLSGDGKRVAFVTAEALAEDDRNGTNDVYVADVDEPRRFRLVKPDAARAALAVKSAYPSLSEDGQRVSFVSKPTQFDPRVVPIEQRVYLVDLPLRKVEAVRRGSERNPFFGDGYSAPLMIPDGSGAVLSTKEEIAANDGNRTVDAYFAAFSFAPMTDVDGDEMDDEWEKTEFGDLDETAGGDEDHDGWSNLQEFLAGTDPTDGNSVLRLEVMDAADGRIMLRWEALPEHVYEVQSKANLADAWQVLTEEFSSGGGIMELDIDELQEREFYRIRLKE
jgi:Tol biopolymer transport system component